MNVNSSSPKTDSSFRYPRRERAVHLSIVRNPSPREEEEQLFARIAQGDKAALAELHDRLAPRAFGLAWRLVGSRAEAEELVQETFIELWHNAPRYDPRRAAPDQWVFTLLKARAIDRHRQNNARGRLSEKLLLQPEPEHGPGPDHQMESVHEASVLREALAQLPVEQRRALEHAYDSGLSQSEIAEVTGAPLGTVKTRMRLGLIRLEELLAPNVSACSH